MNFSSEIAISQGFDILELFDGRYPTDKRSKKNDQYNSKKEKGATA
jgi:hypothetical protein